MKWLVSFAMFMSMSVFGQTVINFDDGSTYTMEEGQEIYISNVPLFGKQTMNNNDVIFRAQSPWSARDYVPDEDGTDEVEQGSHEWCEAYVPWHEGLTFDMIMWRRVCDTNNDGVYNEEDKKWED
jgi:hypothetical protein